jgi:hypothetical protein
VILLRGLGMPYSVLPNGDVVNPARIKISNRENQERSYTIDLAQGGPGHLLMDDEAMRVAPGDSITRAFFIQVPPSTLSGGPYDVHLRVRDGHAFDREVSYRLLGPQGQAKP